MANGQPNVKRANVQPATALIAGITGQDGPYTSAALSTSLAEFLLYKGYEVHGVIRRASTFTYTCGNYSGGPPDPPTLGGSWRPPP